ncbi:UNVERIFIED_CONTAM: hypothetical protein NCL1_26132 [Trichonephila clavipes]
MDLRPPGLDHPGHAEPAGNRARHRQHHFPVHPGQQGRGCQAPVRAHLRPRPGHGLAHPAAAVHHLGHAPDRAADHPGRRLGHRARHHPHRRRPVPALEGRHGDLRHRRRRLLRGTGDQHGRRDQLELLRHHRADRHHRYRVLAGLGDHRGRPGRRRVDHGHRHHAVRGRHDVRRQADRRLCRCPSVDQGARPGLPGHGRHGADRRRLRPAHSEGLHLRRHGVLGPGRDAQHPHAQASRAGRLTQRAWITAAPAGAACKHEGPVKTGPSAFRDTSRDIHPHTGQAAPAAAQAPHDDQPPA